MKPKAGPPGTGRGAVLQQTALVGLAAVLVWVVGQLGFLVPIERRAVQQLLIWNPPETSPNVVVVRITDVDYESQFGGQSPLDRVALARLVAAIGGAGPCAIGLDVDTSDKRFTGMRFGADVPVVWAEGAAVAAAGLRVAAAAGGDATVDTGLAIFRPDGDGVLRRYRRTWEARPSFACAVIAAARRNCVSLPGGDRLDDAARACAVGDRDDRYVQYAPARDHRSELRFTAAEVIAASDAQLAAALQQKIVLLGGAYRASGDIDRPTPIGPLPGVEIIAHTISGELRGGGYRPVGPYTVPAMFLVNEYLLALLIDGLGPVRAAASLVIVIPVVAAVFTAITGGPFAYFLLIVTFLLVLNSARLLTAPGKKTLRRALDAGLAGAWSALRSRRSAIPVERLRRLLHPSSGADPPEPPPPSEPDHR